MEECACGGGDDERSRLQGFSVLYERLRSTARSPIPPERVQSVAWGPTPRCSLAAKRRLGGAARDDPNAAIGIARSAPARDRDAGDVDRVSVCSTATLRGRHLVPPFGQLQLPGRRRSGGIASAGAQPCLPRKAQRWCLPMTCLRPAQTGLERGVAKVVQVQIRPAIMGVAVRSG